MGDIYLYVLFLLKVIAISTSVFLPYMVKPMGLLSKSLFRFYFSAAFKKTWFYVGQFTIYVFKRWTDDLVLDRLGIQPVHGHKNLLLV